MITKNNQALKRFTYICLSLSSILFSSEVQAGGYFSKGSSNVEEDASTSYRQRRQHARSQREIRNEEGFLDSAIKLRKKMEARAERADNLFDKLLGATISTIAPKMNKEEKEPFVKAIKDYLKD